MNGVQSVHIPGRDCHVVWGCNDICYAPVNCKTWKRENPSRLTDLAPENHPSARNQGSEHAVAPVALGLRGHQTQAKEDSTSFDSCKEYTIDEQRVDGASEP